MAGEVIEHISNQGIFLENMRKYLKKNGIMIITTPNMSSLKFIFWLLLGKFENFRIDPEHTFWHSEETLKTIAERHGWKIRKIYYSYVKPAPWW
ncbi:MAG: class I SAM-dependent methyltransferase [Candidatus Omnitrophica bacterium]|nr:class I SAM-dependent methyltransferase [Candidatus Omnitrophota bacterium]